MKRRYLDHNATTPLGLAARDAMTALLGDESGAAFGNPSSTHGSGRRARDLVERGRRAVAALVGATPLDVTFTGSGSEAIAIGMIGLARRARAANALRTRILIGATEHPAVTGAGEVLAAEGFSIARLPVDRGGRVIVDAEPSDERVALVSVQVANNETGVLQPVVELAAAARAGGAFMLADAVQAAGKIPVDRAALGVDALALAAHKLYGPKGIGALVLRDGIDVDALVPGGHQERGRRAGTEAVWAIAGFGAAADEARALLADEGARQGALRDRFEPGLCALGATVFGAEHPRVPNTTSFAFPGATGQLVAIALDLAGFEISTGAACSSGSVKPSSVLLAAGHDPALAIGALRVSFGRSNDADDVDALLAALPEIVARVRAA